MADSLIKRVIRWTNSGPKKPKVAVDLESQKGVTVAVPCVSCGREFTHSVPRGDDGYLRDGAIQITCHKCSERERRFCTCEKCIRDREHCRRCGLKHESREVNWECETCGAILCSNQVALVGGFSERCVHVVFPKKGSPVIEIGSSAEGPRESYSICGTAERVKLPEEPELCPDCGMYDGQECEKHGHWGETVKA